MTWKFSQYTKIYEQGKTVGIQLNTSNRFVDEFLVTPRSIANFMTVCSPEWDGE